MAAKCTRETHAALDKMNTSQSSGPSAPPPPRSGGSLPHLEAEICKVRDMAEACRLHAGNAMQSAQEALGSQTAAHENAVAAGQAAAGMSRVDTQVAGRSSHTCTAHLTPELQVQIELLNPQMKEMNNALQLAINNVADMATDKFASVSARVQDFEDSLLGKLGSPKNGGPRLGDLDPDIRAHSDQLTRIWKQLEMQNHDLDLYLETLRDMEKKGAQNEPERQQNSRSEGPRDSLVNPQPTSSRTGGETGPWYNDRRSEPSYGSPRSRSRDRPFFALWLPAIRVGTEGAKANPPANDARGNLRQEWRGPPSAVRTPPGQHLQHPTTPTHTAPPAAPPPTPTPAAPTAATRRHHHPTAARSP